MVQFVSFDDILLQLISLQLAMFNSNAVSSV